MEQLRLKRSSRLRNARTLSEFPQLFVTTPDGLPDMLGLMKAIAATLALACMLGPTAASAQTADDTAQRARTGDTIFVTDLAGQTSRARLVSISTDSVRVLSPAARDIPLDQLLRIDKLGDPLRDGFLRGAVVGGAVGAFAALTQGDFPYSLLKVTTGMAEFALIGGLVDWLHRGHTTIYRAPEKSVTVAPVIAPGRRGLALSVTF